MSERKFEILDLRSATVQPGMKLDLNASAIYNGYLVSWVTGGSVGLETGSPIGVLYDRQPLEEYPESLNLATLLAGKRTAFVTGNFTAWVGKNLFKSGAVPAAGSKVYPGGNGLLAETGGGAGCIGIVLDTGSVRHSAGDRDIALVRYDLTAIL